MREECRLACALHSHAGMTTEREFARSREGRLRHVISVMRQRLHDQRELLLAPRLELVPVRHATRSHARLEAMRRQLR
jgi:hypothetical protein